MFNSQQFKQAFPLFSQPENQQLVYLDNAATTQRPQCVLDAITDFYLHSNANTHRSSHRLARRATEMVERVRAQLASFVNAEASEEIIFTRGATEALNLLAASIGQTLQQGDEIILSEAEHHANLVPWQMLAERHGLTLRYLPCKSDGPALGVPDLARLPELLNERSRLLAITAASNVLGWKLDLAALRETLQGSGCPLLLDATQLLAHESVDVQALNCDYLVGSAHKFYGPTGVGFVYGKASALATLPPWQGGGEMIETVTLDGSVYASAPHRFEAGTSSLAAIAGLGAALDFLAGWDRRALHAHECELLTLLHDQLAQLPFVHVLTQAENNLGLAVFVPSADCPLSAVDIAHWLDEHDIAVRVGHHCAQPLVDSLGMGPALRISLAGYSCQQDVARLIDALQALPMEVATGSTQESANELFSDPQASLSLADLSDQGWQQRYRRLMKWGDTLMPKPSIRLPENVVKGCESQAWLLHRCIDGRHEFAIDSEARVVKGLSVLLLLLVQGRRTEEINRAALQQTFIDYGLDKHLSVSRSNGFAALVDAVLKAVSEAG